MALLTKDHRKANRNILEGPRLVLCSIYLLHLYKEIDSVK